MTQKQVHPELRAAWQNCDKIFAARLTRTTAEVSSIPNVDWSKVNCRMIKNVPDPVPCTIFGVSDDPDFYRDYPEKATTPYCITCKFHKYQPFGTMPGHHTTCGVIPPGCDQVLHGYTWSEENRSFVLQAHFPSAKKEMIKQVVSTNKKVKRKWKELR